MESRVEKRGKVGRASSSRESAQGDEINLIKVKVPALATALASERERKEEGEGEEEREINRERKRERKGDEENLRRRELIVSQLLEQKTRSDTEQQNRPMCEKEQPFVHK